VSAGNLALSSYMADVFTTPIDELLSECTDNEVEQQVCALLAAGRKVEAVKLAREATQLGLGDAKDLVESLNLQ
jgi:ribosomal protein L7/L12